MDISDLAGLHREVEEITADLDVWAGRQEPDSRARRYGSADSPAFVNGVLDRLRREAETPPEKQD